MILVLLAALAVQFALPSNTPLPPDSPLAPRRPRAPVAALVPQYPAVLRAPIFSPDRTPGEAGGAGAAATGLQVMGLAAGGRTASAIVRGPDGASHVLAPGEMLQGWRLISVGSAGATFAGPSGHVRIPIGGASSPPVTTTAGAAGRPPEPQP